MKVQRSTYGDSYARTRTPRFLVFLEIKMRKNTDQTKKHCFGGGGVVSFNTCCALHCFPPYYQHKYFCNLQNIK